MAVSLRLMRVGKRGFPNYRIVAIERKRKRNGLYLEKVGFYDPLVNPPRIEIDKERFKRWLQYGAVISEGLRKLIGKRLKKDFAS